MTYFRVYDYALNETIHLMEGLVGRPGHLNEIEDKHGIFLYYHTI
jgi:hypothetical protein